MHDDSQSGDPEGRPTRTRRLVHGLGTAVVGRGLALSVPVVLVPLLYRQFGPVQYGAWATVVATTSMFLWADLGLGNALMTRLPSVLARGEEEAARALVSTAYSALTALALVFVILLLAGSQIISWDSVMGLESASQVNFTVTVCFALLFLNIPLGLVQRVQYADQEVARSNLYQMAGPAFTMVAASAAVAADRSYSETVVMVALGPVVGSTVASTVFYSRRPELRPRLVAFWTPDARAMVNLGVAFLGIQICSAIAMNADNLIAARIANPEQLGHFSVNVRVFLVLGGVITVAMLPLWPTTSEALAGGDHAWVRKTTRVMSALGGGATFVGGLTLLIAGPDVLPILLGGPFPVDSTLMFGLTLGWTVLGATAPLFMVQNSVGYLRAQFWSWPAFVLIALPLKYAIGLQFGIEWIPFVGAIVYVVIISPAALYGYRAVMDRSMRPAIAHHLKGEA